MLPQAHVVLTVCKSLGIMKKKLYEYFVLICVLAGFGVGDLHGTNPSWSLPVIISESNFVYLDVTTCYDSTHNRTFAAWVDGSTNQPIFSIYNGSSWSTPALISENSRGNTDIFLCHDQAHDIVIAAWGETYATYSIYNGSGWSDPATIDTSFAVSGHDVYLCYDANREKIMATWSGGDSSEPVYALYGLGTWSSAAVIASDNSVTLNVYTSYNATTHEIYAAWSNSLNNNCPTLATFNGSTWSSPSSIDSSSQTNNVFLSFNSTDNKLLATWKDQSSLPKVAFYQSGSWSEPTFISSNTVYNSNSSLFSCYDSINNQFFVMWPDSSSFAATYSKFSAGSWSSPALIHTHPPGVYANVFPSFNTQNREIMAVWGEIDSNFPYYSILSTAPDLSAPSNLRSRQQVNNFGIIKEIYNKLSWQPSPSEGVVGYNIYRNSQWLASVDSNTFYYEDHNRMDAQTSTYSVTSFNESHEESSEILTIITNSL